MESLCRPCSGSVDLLSLASSSPKQRIGSSLQLCQKKHYRLEVCCSSETMNNSSLLDQKPKETKLWGGRFEESVTDAVEKFSESISFDKALYKQDIMGSRAHATMLAHQGLISSSDRDCILQGLDEIEKSIEAGEFIWRTDREDVHMNIEAALIDMIGEPAKRLHTARSRNDQVVTDLRLWCRDAIGKIVSRIKYLQRTVEFLPSRCMCIGRHGSSH